MAAMQADIDRAAVALMRAFIDGAPALGRSDTTL